jgi:hypothetical protein
MSMWGTLTLQRAMIVAHFGDADKEIASQLISACLSGGRKIKKH